MMTEPPWDHLTEAWERLAWARERKFASRAEAARALGMKEGTYRAYERPSDASKATALDYEAAQKFARRFGVSWPWLLNGVGKPFDSLRLVEPEDELWSIYQQMDPAQKSQLLAIARTFTLEQGAESGANTAGPAAATDVRKSAPRKRARPDSDLAR